MQAFLEIWNKNVRIEFASFNQRIKWMEEKLSSSSRILDAGFSKYLKLKYKNSV